jgi:hypothetical protein
MLELPKGTVGAPAEEGCYPIAGLGKIKLFDCMVDNRLSGTAGSCVSTNRGKSNIVPQAGSAPCGQAKVNYEASREITSSSGLGETPAPVDSSFFNLKQWYLCL